VCLIGLALNHFPQFPMVMVANRDEFHARPTQSLHRWDGPARLWAGRDLQAGGTWLGATAGGRICALTNLRGEPAAKLNAPSRGELVAGFLQSEALAPEWLADLEARSNHYAGFNLLLSDDARTFHLLSNQGDQLALSSGVHAISNGRWGETWPKTERLVDSLSAVMEPESTDALAAVMTDETVPPDSALPDTGVGIEAERRLAPALIRGDEYGTRSTSVLQLDNRGMLRLTELTRDRTGQVVATQTVTLPLA